MICGCRTCFEKLSEPTRVLIQETFSLLREHSSGGGRPCILLDPKLSLLEMDDHARNKILAYLDLTGNISVTLVPPTKQRLVYLAPLPSWLFSTCELEVAGAYLEELPAPEPKQKSPALRYDRGNLRFGLNYLEPILMQMADKCWKGGVRDFITAAGLPEDTSLRSLGKALAYHQHALYERGISMQLTHLNGRRIIILSWVNQLPDYLVEETWKRAEDLESTIPFTEEVYA